MFERFTERARQVIVLAQSEAREMNHDNLGTHHILLGILAEGNGLGAKALLELGLDLERTRATVVRLCPRGTGTAGRQQVPFSPPAKVALEQALREALRMSHAHVSSEHMLLGVLHTDSVAIKVIEEEGTSAEEIRATIDELLVGGDVAVPIGTGAPSSSTSPSAGTRRLTPLKDFGRNLNALAEEGKLDPVVGRDSEIERVMQILSRRTKNNPVLVGEPGVGKTAVVEGLALKIQSGEAPSVLRDKLIFSLDLAALVAGAKYRGEFEQRLRTVMKEVTAEGSDIVLFIDEIHNLVGAGGAEGAIDAASILKPALARGELQTIGATTLEEYRRYVERDSALERRFQPVKVGEPSVDDTVRILEGLRGSYEDHHKVQITDEGLAAAATYADRYISDRFLPDKAIDLIDEASSRVRMRAMSADPRLDVVEGELEEVRHELEATLVAERYEEGRALKAKERSLMEQRDQLREQTEDLLQMAAPLVGEPEIADIVTMWTGIPVARVTATESAKLIDMESQLHRRVIGQDAAITAVSKAIRRSRAGIKDPKRPAGSFIFLGPSGVGKTELARTLADFLFGDEEAMIRIDMSEYMEKHAVSRLVGSPPGYIGYDEGGQLTEAVRRKPYSVLLLDEIEKAHPDVFNILLQILEDGRLTDSQGRTVDFRNAIVIMTSNIGAAEIARNQGVGFTVSEGDLGESHDAMRGRVMSDLKRAFRPELLNRIDEVIVFHKLSREQVQKIIELMLVGLRARLAEHGIRLELEEGAAEYLASSGFDPTMGARPLRRAIQRYIEDPLADQILGAGAEENEGVVVHVERVADPVADGPPLILRIADGPIAAS